MSLTDAEVKAFKSHGKRLRRSDGGGLFLDVMPSGRKFFRLAYRSDGKQRTALIGEYPQVRLIDARLKAADIKTALRSGVDPKETERAFEAVEATSNDPDKPTWREVAGDYVMLRQRSGAARRTMAKLLRQVDVTIEKLGDRTLDDITSEDVLSVVNPIAEDGRVETAHEIRSRFSQIFRYAAARGLVQHDPAAVTTDAMVRRRRGEFAGLTGPKAVGQLMRDIHVHRKRHWLVGSALLLSAYLFPRSAELRGMRWNELDLKESLWEVPGERMKMKRDHVVPLPTQVLAVLEELRRIDLGSPLVFPSPRNLCRTLSEMTLNAALRRMGYGGDRHVHHGFRTTASTNLNEMGWNSDWIERQLAHVPANKVRSSYNKAEYLDGRRRMMQAYADWLDERAGDKAGHPR